MVAGAKGLRQRALVLLTGNVLSLQGAKAEPAEAPCLPLSVLVSQGGLSVRLKFLLRGADLLPGGKGQSLTFNQSRICPKRLAGL